VTYWIDCPKLCGGEKALEENRIPWNEALSRTGGNADRAWVIDQEFSCECPLTDEEFDALQQQADLIAYEQEPAGLP
jgi:hypothetical protein